MNTDLAAIIGGVAGIILSLVLKYFPKLNVNWDRLGAETKQLIVWGLCLVVALAIFGLSCADWINVVACTKAGIKEIIAAFVSMLVSSQATHEATSLPRSVREDRAGRTS